VDEGGGGKGLCPFVSIEEQKLVSCRNEKAILSFLSRLLNRSKYRTINYRDFLR
jgi:hypothetical protein